MKWIPWINSCLRMIDSKGTYTHYPVAGGLYDQPALDMTIYDIIRYKWIELQNKRMVEEQNKWRQKSR
ncbi:MAG: hypothetical protein WCS51_03560 [Bacilli bacterium]